jgi:hypothetical protein
LAATGFRLTLTFLQLIVGKTLPRASCLNKFFIDFFALHNDDEPHAARPKFVD